MKSREREKIFIFKQIPNVPKEEKTNDGSEPLKIFRNKIWILKSRERSVGGSFIQNIEVNNDVDLRF